VVDRAEDRNGLVREVILENFMSHSYSRIPLKPGLNLVCGPNGAGKSSILLGLAVALGQTYTERSRKLGDLVRRGKDVGRVSIVFNNAHCNGKRPIPSVDADTVVLSRYLNKDGNYWHEINNRTVMKGEVIRLLQRLSINPDNMLIIMHQNMIDVFSAIGPQEKLRLTEEAVGLGEYRERILEAMKKLSHTLSEEESIKNLLEKAQETLRYWGGEFERFKRKRGLEGKRGELEIEHAWAKCMRQGETIGSLQAELRKLDSELAEIKADSKRAAGREKRLETELGKLEFELDGIYQRLIEHERAQAERETEVKLTRNLREALKDLRAPGMGPFLDRLEADASRAKTYLEEAEGKAKVTEAKLVELKKKLERQRESYVDTRVQLALLGFRGELLEREISRVQRELRRARRELEALEEEAAKVGARVDTKRKPQEILEELRMINAQLATLADVSPDVERMYLSYKNTIKELEEKARVAEANRRRALEDLELRKRRWQSEITKLLRGTKEEYLELLGRVNGSGDVRLVNPHDIEEAGLELLVGFGGTEPQVLDAYTQSGGERTTASMCFLLALQRRIKSPLRAVDEFETHLDPRNREELLLSIIESMEGDGAQYILITPGRVMHVGQVPNVITVQNVAGVSRVRVVA
jgi:chromosome segregation protein